jgi:hypothetical protein
MQGRPSDDALWASVEATVREVLLPAITDEHARAAAINLVGLSAYRRTRGPDHSCERRATVSAALDSLADNPLVAPHWPGAPGITPSAAASAVLVDAVGRSDEAAVAVRRVLRALLVSFLDEDVTVTAVLGTAFRGRLPDA